MSSEFRDIFQRGVAYSFLGGFVFGICGCLTISQSLRNDLIGIPSRYPGLFNTRHLCAIGGMAGLHYSVKLILGCEDDIHKTYSRKFYEQLPKSNKSVPPDEDD